MAAAKKHACDAWNAAADAMVGSRQPFIDKTQPGMTWDWNDPAIQSAQAQAQAGTITQVEYLRRNVPPATPPEVANPISDYIAASIDMIAADGQHQPAAVANAAANRGSAAAAKIRTACGIR
ncbi:hypothetical protein [Mycobacterium avium]|uniref:hypothetical protein n=1 Tax=Mycobacterium avium TaxID=1764 RepID=UPI00111C6FC4|nr:hypothetical protein [Mycobacterium avium]